MDFFFLIFYSYPENNVFYANLSSSYINFVFSNGSPGVFTRNNIIQSIVMEFLMERCQILDMYLRNSELFKFKTVCEGRCYIN